MTICIEQILHFYIVTVYAYPQNRRRSRGKGYGACALPIVSLCLKITINVLNSVKIRAQSASDSLF